MCTEFRSRKKHSPLSTVLRLQAIWFLLAFILLFVHQDSLDKFSILFIRHNPLDHFCPCVTLFWINFLFCSFITILLTTFVHASRCCERVLDDRRNRRLDKAPLNGIHHDLPSSARGTQLHVFVWRNSGSGPRSLVCASLGFSSPDNLETRIFPERTWCCTHKSPTAKCRTFPNPSRWTIPIAAVAPDLIATRPHKQKSFKIDCSPIPSVAALTTAANSDAPLLKARSLGPRFHELATPHRHTSHCGFSRGVASSKVCITKHLNIAVQLGPWISAGHSRVFDCVSCNCLEGSEVLSTW